MPRGMGYPGYGYSKAAGGYGPKSRPNHPRHDSQQGMGPTSYRDSPAKTPATGDKTNRHGFSRNPRQSSPGRMTSNPFPTNVGQDIRGDAGLPYKGKMGSYHGSHGPKSGMRSKSHKGY